MKYIVYKTTNLKASFNNTPFVYIGVHKTENPDHVNYLGCGVKKSQPSTYANPKTPFQYAVKKYGVDAFKRETLFVFDNEKDAYNKEHELVNEDFIKLPYVYNVAIGGEYEERYKPLYQFDLKGNLVKKWERSLDVYEEYGYPGSRFEGPKRNKTEFLGYYWSTSPEIDVRDFNNKKKAKTTYLYSKEGKLLNEFSSMSECASYINYNAGELTRAIKNQSLVRRSYYISYELIDIFIKKPRVNYVDLIYFVYDSDSNYIGEFKGKEIMPIIELTNWSYMEHIFTHSRNWYNNFYVSLARIDKVPFKHYRNGTCIDVFDKNGNYIETIKSIKETQEKYKLPANKLKNIKEINKEFGNYIFKYHK